MTNEELDRARVDEAIRLWDGSKGSLAVIAARLAREGWMPPVAVDPDLAEVAKLTDGHDGRDETWYETVLKAIKRGRELERAALQPKEGEQ